MYKTGLVLEGGGSRAIYTSGVLDAFIENKIEFPYVIGVSAGSCNGTSYIAKNYKRQHDITINYCDDKRYMGFNSLLKTGEYLNGDWLFGELAYDIVPLNQSEFDKSDSVLCVVATNAVTGKAEYSYPKDMHSRGCPWLRASCSMPGVTKGVKIGKDIYFDGGIVDSIPLMRAFDDGCQKAVVILTQDRQYHKPPIGHDKLLRKVLKKYPLMANRLLNRHNMYNDQRRYAFEAEKTGDVFIIAPSEPLNCSTLEKRKEHLEAIYQTGYMDGLKSIDAVKAFISK